MASQSGLWFAAPRCPDSPRFISKIDQFSPPWNRQHPPFLGGRVGLQRANLPLRPLSHHGHLVDLRQPDLLTSCMSIFMQS